jgi:hypothetical protein
VIFKIQRPMMPADGDWMAYTRGKKNTVFIPPELVNDELRKLMGDAQKIYVEAHLDVEETLVIARKVAAQDW